MAHPSGWSTTYHPETVLLLRVETPLFIGGADIPKTDPVVEGLRVPSIRGALRYWARAILSQPYSVTLAGREADVFGSASNPSKLTVKSYWSPEAHLSPADWQTLVNGAERQGLVADAQGLRYLGQVALRKVGDTARKGLFRTGDNQPLGALVHLGWRGPSKPSPDQGRLVVGALWLLCTFGGIGTRARRGFGAIRVAKVLEPGIFGDFLEEQSFKPRGADDIRSELSKLAALSPPPRATNAYPNLSCLSIYLSKDRFHSPLAAMAAFGSRYQEYRSQLPLKKRIPFGLPIPLRGRKRGNIPNKRRASPLWVRPLRLWDADSKQEPFVLAAAHFKDQFFPTPDKGVQQQVDHGVIDNFLVGTLNMQRVWP